MDYKNDVNGLYEKSELLQIIDIGKSKTNSNGNSSDVRPGSVKQLINVGNPQLYPEASASNYDMSVVDLENKIKPFIQNAAMFSEDPAGVVAQEDLTQMLKGIGVEESAARNIAKANGMTAVSGIDIRNKGFGEQLVTTAKNACFNEVKGLSSSLAFLFEVPELIEVANKYQNKIISNPESRDYGMVGNLVLDGVQPLSSSLSFLMTTAFMSWLPGGFGFKSAAKVGLKLAGGINFLKAGLSQGGNVMYDLSLIEDAEGNKIDMTTPTAKSLSTALVILMGGVEMWSLDQIPGYKKLTKHFTGQEIKKFISEGVLDFAKKNTWDILKSMGAEGIEEGVQAYLGAGFENLLKHIANKEGSDFDLTSLKEVTDQAIHETIEATRSMLLPSILLGGITNGIYHARVSAEAKKNFQPTKTSQQLPVEFLAVPNKIETESKSEATPEAKTEAKTEAETEKKVEEEKLDPIKGVIMRGRFVPTNETENQKAREAQERGATVVEIELEDSLQMDQTQMTPLVNKAAIQTGGKIVGENKLVYENQGELNKAVYLLKNAIIDVDQKDNNTTLTIRNEDGTYNNLQLGLATEEEPGTDPDLSYVENPDAPYRLSLMTKERAIEWTERENIKKAFGDVTTHTGGNISSADLEATVDFIILVAKTAEVTTDELLKKILDFELVTEMETPQHEVGNANISYEIDMAGQKKYTITINKTANVASLFHEVGHLMRGLATKEQLQDFVNHYGGGNTAIWLDDIAQTEDGKYKLGEKIFKTYAEAKKVAEKYEEKFANDLVTYIKTGEAPTTKLQNIFRRMKAVLQKIVNRYGYNLDPEVKNAFDKLFSNEANIKEQVVSKDLGQDNVLYQIAWQGTVYEFDKYDINKIGFGEGNQSYGHGFYFTQTKGLAEEYAKQIGMDKLRRKNASQNLYRVDGVEQDFRKVKQFSEEYYYRRAVEIIGYNKYNYKHDKDQAIKAVEFEIKLAKERAAVGIENFELLLGYRRALREIKTDNLYERIEQPDYSKVDSMVVYTVDIPDDGFIEWRDAVPPKFEENFIAAEQYRIDNFFNEYTAEEIEETFRTTKEKITKELQDNLEELSSSLLDPNVMGKVKFFNFHKFAKNFLEPDEIAKNLLHMGYKGVHYKTEFEQETNDNFVVFDPNDIKIQSRRNLTIEEVFGKNKDQEYLDAVKANNMERVVELVDEAASKAVEKGIEILPDDSENVAYKYHRGPIPEQTKKAYAVFNVGNGLRAAFAGTQNTMPIGVWLDAQAIESIPSTTKTFPDGSPKHYIPGDTGLSAKEAGIDPVKHGLPKGQKFLFFRPGKHAADIPNFSQMNVKDIITGKRQAAMPHDKIVFEIEVGADVNLTDQMMKEAPRHPSTGRPMMREAGLQRVPRLGNKEGYYEYKTNPNAKGNWIIASAFKINRVVPYNEIAAENKKAGLPVPVWNGGYTPHEFGLTDSAIQTELAKVKKIKDPVVYDVKGNVIPLSERFNKNSNTLYETVNHKTTLEDRVANEDLDIHYATIEDIRDHGGYVDNNGYVTLYHRTSAENASQIAKDGRMIAKEDGLFFSTKKDGEAVGYGNSVVSLEIPIEQLQMDDIFEDEIHFRLPIKFGEDKDITSFLPASDLNETEQDAVINKYKGTTEWLKAPNGKDSNLNEDLWIKVRTPAFKKWFGDWENDSARSSKVVDENGEPLVVYHGTPSGGFEEFKMPSYPSVMMSQQGGGYYFTDKANAKQYMSNVGDKTGNSNNAQLYQVFLNIKDPLMTSSKSGKNISLTQYLDILKEGNRDWFFSNWIYFDGNISKDINRDEALIQYAEQLYKRKSNDVGLLSESVRAFKGSSITEAYTKVLKNDGLKYSDKHGDIWVSWESNQIKSTDNIGEWSPEKNNILFEKLINDRSSYEMAYHGSTYIFDKMSTENVGVGGNLNFGWGLYLTKEDQLAANYADVHNENVNHILYTIKIPEGNYLNWYKNDQTVVELANKISDYILELDQKGEFETRRETSLYRGNLTAKEVGDYLRERMSHPEIQRVQQLYEHLAGNIGSEFTSKILNELGYTGIQYDYFGGEDLNSFVIFNGDDLQIKARKNLDTNVLFEKAAPVNSKTFKTWFGDSKVVNKQGTPLLVYHGTGNSSRFTTFDPKKGFNVEGIYHAASKKAATHWSGSSTVARFKNISEHFATLDSVRDVTAFIEEHFDDQVSLEYFPAQPAQDPSSSDPILNQPTSARWMINIEYSDGGSMFSAVRNIESSKMATTEQEVVDYLKYNYQSDVVKAENAIQGTGTLYANYLKIENPLEVDAKGQAYHNIEFEGERVNTEYLVNKAKAEGYDGLIVRNVLETDYENIKTDDYIVFDPTQVKSQDNTGRYDPNNPNILYETNVRTDLPKVRGGWTEEKIIRALKNANHKITKEFYLSKEIAKFDNAQDFLDHVYYHGTGGSIVGTLRPSIAFSDRKVEQIGGGGYGEKYWGISLSKRKRTSEIFSGQSQSVSIYPVILDKNANVIERYDLEDAVELEDEIVQLWEDGIDAVWIGGGEQELVVLNPYAIHVYDQSEVFRVFGGLKSEQTTLEQAEAIYKQAQIDSKLTRQQRADNPLDKYLFEKAKTLTLEDLDMMGIKSFVPIFSDRNVGGVPITGMKSLLLPEVEHVGTYGGVKFPEVGESGENIVWAVDKQKAATSIYNQALETAPIMPNGERSNKGYGIVVIMGDDSHMSNRSAVDGYMRLLYAYLNDRRVFKKDQNAIYKLLKTKELAKMPNFKNKEAFSKWLNEESTFKTRKMLLKGFAKPTVQEYGVPPVGLYMSQIAETEYNVPNMRYGDGLIVLEFDLEDFSVKLGEEGTNTKPHPSYNIGIKGRLLGKLPVSLGRDILFDSFKEKENRSVGSLMVHPDYRSAQMKLPLIELNEKVRKVIKAGALTEIKGSKPASMLVDFLSDNWITSDLPSNKGGVKAAEYMSALSNNIGAESLSKYDKKELNKAIAKKEMKLYKLKGSEVYFSTSKEQAWYTDFVEYESEDSPRVTDSEISLTGVINNELNVRGSLAIIMGKAIEEGITILDAYEVKSPKFPNGKLPTLYGNHGFETFGRIKWNEEEFLKEHTKTELKDLKAYWTSEGWDEKTYGMPDIVAMRLNEEKIGGRDGYIQRLVDNDGEGVWGRGTTEGIAREGDSYQHDGESSGQHRVGERDGREPSGNNGSSFRRGRRSSISRATTELLSLTEEQAYNVGVHPDTIKKLKETYQKKDNTLYELSEEAKAKIIEDRKADVKKAVEEYYWIPDLVLKEYANEDWAKQEMKFRDFVKKNPGIITEAKNFIDENNFLEHIQTSEGMGDYKWVEEDSTWFKRVHAYSRILTPKEKDSQFIRLHTVSNEKLIKLSQRIRNYEDIKEDGDTKKVVYKWGVFDGVTPTVKNLSKASTDAEFDKARSDIEKDPRAYRKALQVIAQAEERVDQFRGDARFTGDSQMATRDAYYDQLGDELSEIVDPTETKASFYKYTEKEKVKSLEEAIADQTQIIEELRQIGAESETNLNMTKKDLSAAKSEVKTLKKSLSEETQKIKELQKSLKEKSLEATKARALDERRNRVAELRKQLTEQNQKVRTLNKKNTSLSRRLEANKTREILTYMNKKLKRLSKFNNTTTDAVFEDKLYAVQRLFATKKAYPIEFEDTTYFIPQHVEWIKEGKMAKTWPLEHLLLLEESLKTMKLDGRTMLDEKITRRSNRLQNIAVELYRQTYGVTPEITPSYGSIMNDIVADLMSKQKEYEPNTFKNILHTVKTSIGKMQRIARELDGHTEGIMYDLLVRQAYENMTEELRESQRRLELADEKMVELGITANSLAKDGFTYTSSAGQKKTLTKSEVIGLYVYSLNNLGLQKLIHVNGNNIDMTTLGQAISSLTDNEKAWGDYMIDSLGADDVWERQAEIYYNVYNRNLGRRDNYFTFVGEGTHGDEGKADLINGTKGVVSRYVDKSFTHEVNPNAIYPLKLNVTSTFTSQVKKQEHFINWAAWVRDMNYLMERGAIGRIIEMEKGPKYKVIVQDYINDVGSPQTLLDDIERLGSKIISNASVAALSLNFLTMLKQLASFSAAIRGDVGMVELLSVSTRLMNPQSHAETVKFIHEMSPYMKKRAISVEVEKYNATDFDTKAGRAIAEFNEKVGMKGISMMDQAAVNTLWLASYDTYLRRNPNNLQGEALKKEAAFKATQLISETQPTSIVTDLASIQRKKGPFVRSVLLFTNQMFQYINMVWYDIPTSVKAYKATKDPTYMRKAFGSVMNMAISGALILLISGAAFRKDDEDDDEYFERMGKEVLKTTANYTVPLAGNSIAQGASGFSPGSIVELPTSIGRLIGTDFSDLDKVSDRMWDILLDSASITGLPTAFVQRAIKAAKNKNLFEFLGSNYGKLWETR